MIGLFASEAFQQADFQVAGRDFRVTKMQPIPAYKLFMEHVRPCLAAMSGVDFPEVKEDATEEEIRRASEKQMGAMMQVFANIEYAHLDALWKAFARECIYTRNDAGQMVRITMDPEGLTQGLDPAHLMILVARAFARNFGGSVSEFVKEMGMMAPPPETDSSQKSPSRSSTQESEQDTSPSLI